MSENTSDADQFMSFDRYIDEYESIKSEKSKNKNV